MKGIGAIVLSGAVFAIGCTHGGAGAGAPDRAQAARNEAELSDFLAGRVAGSPEDCIDESDLAANRSFGNGVIVFSSRTGGVLWVNRPAGGCPGLAAGRAIQTQTPKTRLCRGDIVSVFDPLSGAAYGSCTLSEFTPYRHAP